MGNLSSKSGNSNISLEESTIVHNDWNILSGKLNGNNVTLFSSQLPASSRKKPFIDRAVQFSRIYRHPSLLKYVDVKVNGEELNIVAERAVPLLEYDLSSISSLGVIVGLVSILEGLIFLHDKAGMSHNNVCPSSIYITSDGSWKLWGFEYMCSFGELTKDHIERIDQYCCQKFIPPEQKTTISPAYQHARDSYAFAQLIIDLSNEEIATDIFGFDELLMFIKAKCLHKDWTKRPRLSVIQCQTVFKHEFLQIKHNISNILLLSAEDKEKFIRSLPSKLKEYPEELIATSLMSSLLTRPIIDIPGSVTHLMPFILIPNKDESGGFFSPEIYKKELAPLIVKLFSVHDLTIRMTLLKYFYHYVEVIPKECLVNEILPQLLLGIRDCDEGLVASTLIDLAYLVPVLGADVVVGSSREAIFSSNRPKNVKAKKIVKKEPPRKKVPSDAVNIAERAPLPPTRSSPDGGETDVQRSVSVRGEWSDWEELMDDQPDIVGSLKVMTPDNDEVTEIYDRNESSSSARSDNVPSKGRNDSSSSTNTSATMQLQKSLQEKKNIMNDHEMMVNKVAKKQEPDLFEDLKPNIKSPSFNLERMLIEAKSRSALNATSDSKVSSEIQFTDVSGNEWQDETNWSFDEVNT